MKIFYSTSSDNKDDFVELTDKIVINEDTVVRAFARKDGMIDSDVVDFAFEVLVKKTLLMLETETMSLQLLKVLLQQN